MKNVVTLFFLLQIGDQTGEMTAQMNLADFKEVLGIVDDNTGKDIPDVALGRCPSIRVKLETLLCML